MAAWPPFREQVRCGERGRGPGCVQAMDAAGFAVAIEQKCIAADARRMVQYGRSHRRGRNGCIGEIAAALENAHRRQRGK